MADVQLVEISATEGAQIINSTVEAQQPAQIVLAVPGVQGPTGSNLPASGTTHQVLFKQSNTNYDTGWKLITNDNVDGAAAIAGTKISPNFGSQTIQTTGVFSHALGTAGAPSITFTGDVNTGLYSPGADQVAISTGGSGRLFVDASGNVGIGLNSPSSYGRLALSGSNNTVGYFENTNTSGSTTSSQIKLATYDGTAVTAGTVLLETASSWASSQYGGGAANTSVLQGAKAGGVSIIAASASAPIKFYAGGESSTSERMRLDSSGRLGLGTSTPQYNLHGTGYVGLGTQASSGAGAGIHFIPSSTLTNWFAGSNYVTGGTFQIIPSTAGGGSTFTTPAVTIDSSSRVGIGTTSPATTLDQVGSHIVRSTTTNTTYITADANSDVPMLEFYNSGINTFNVGYRGASAPATKNIAEIRVAANSPLVLFTNNTERARIDSSGRLLVGTSSAVSTNSVTAGVELLSTATNNGASLSIARFNNDTIGGQLILAKSRNATVAAGTIVQNGDDLGQLVFNGDDGTDLDAAAARIQCFVDGTPGANDMPGRLVFSTTADGAASPTERMRIASGGNIGIGETNPLSTLSIRKDTVGGRGAELSIVNYAATTQGNEAALNFGLETSTYDGNNGNAQIKAVLPNVGGAATDLVFSNYNGSAFGEAMRIHNQRELLIGTTTRTANGGVLQISNGITFPGTQSACSDPNTLDDYEEGTWTPTVAGSSTTGVGTYTVQSGKYIKTGGLVYVEAQITWTAHTGTGQMWLASLPFTSSSTGVGPGVSFGRISNIALTASNLLLGYVANNSTIIPLRQYPVGGGAESTVPLDTAGEVNFSVSYMVV